MVSDTQFRLYMEAATFYYEQMKANFQDRTKFTFYLLAFVSIARSVTLVFQQEFHGSNEFMKWYKSKRKEWESNRIMRFFRDIRNVTIHKYTPKTTATIRNIWRVDFTKEKPPPIEIRRTDDGREIWMGKLPLKNSKVAKYSFRDVPEGFEENSDVMYLCGKYLDELQRFVTEAENLIKRGFSK